jgi:hypothetical protein
MHRTLMLPQMLTDELVQMLIPQWGCHGSNSIGRDREPAAIKPHPAQVNPAWLIGEYTAQRGGYGGISGPVPCALVPRQTGAAPDDKQPIG